MSLFEKKCTKCLQVKKVCDFGKNNRFKDGLQYNCKECRKTGDKRYYYASLEQNRARKVINTKRYLKTEKGKCSRKELDAKKYVLRKDNIRLVQKIYYSKNKWLNVFKVNKRRSIKLKATPKWADLDKIRCIYELAAKLTKEKGCPYEVDHIIPLQGENVSGLHVHNNLQILTRSENRSKKNKVIC
jgi:hypothetical protein